MCVAIVPIQLLLFCVHIILLACASFPLDLADFGHQHCSKQETSVPQMITIHGWQMLADVGRLFPWENVGPALGSRQVPLAS